MKVTYKGHDLYETHKDHDPNYYCWSTDCYERSCSFWEPGMKLETYEQWLNTIKGFIDDPI